MPIPTQISSGPYVVAAVSPQRSSRARCCCLLFLPGAFGVTTRVYIKAHEFFPAINVVAGSIMCADQSSYTELISTMVELQEEMDAAGHGVSNTPYC
jgi:hypothetical protein